MSYATANRHVNALKVAGLLESDGSRVLLSTRFLYLAELVHQADFLARVGKAVVEKVAQMTGETVILSRLAERYVVGIVRVESHRVVRFSFEPGQRMPLNAGAAAKAILAFVPQATRDRLLATADWRAMTENTITNRELFLQELRVVRSKGWAESRGEVEPDIHAIAVPVFFPWGGVAGSLCVCAPAFRMSEKLFASSLESLREAADEIRHLLREQSGVRSHKRAVRI